MRLDVFLKISRLIVRRSLAQEFCDAGYVMVNDSPAKSSKDVKINDEIEIKRRGRLTKVRVTQVPDKKQISKNAAENLYQLIKDELQENYLS